MTNATHLNQDGVAPAQAASYTYSVVATPPSGYPSAGVLITQYSGPGSSGIERGYSFFPFSTACGLWGPPSDVTYLSCNATHYTVNQFPSDNGTCTGSPMANTYSLSYWTGSNQDLGVTSAGYDVFSCYSPPAIAPSAPATVPVQPAWLAVSSSNYTVNWLLQACLPRYSGGAQVGYVVYVPTLAAVGPPGADFAYFTDPYCNHYSPLSAMSASPAQLAAAYAPAVHSFATAPSTAYSTAGVVMTQYLMPNSTGTIMATLFQALNSCGSLGPPTDVVYLSTNATHYSVNVYPSDNGSCTGAPILTSFPFNKWDGHDGSGPFDLGPYAGYLSVAGYSPSPPPPSPSPPSPPPPPPGSPAVHLAVTLSGLTVAQFQLPAAQNAFSLSVSTTLGVSQDAVTITSVTQSTRRLLSAGGVSVQFTVASTAPAASVAMQLSTGNTFASALSYNFQQSGLPPPTPSTVSASSPAAPSSALAAAFCPVLVSAVCVLLALFA